MPEAPWRQEADGVLVTVRLTPRGGQDAFDEIVTLADGMIVLKARVRAAPEDGAANAALVRLFADTLKLPARDISLAGGATSRVKRIRIQGEPAALTAALETLGRPAGETPLAPKRKK